MIDEQWAREHIGTTPAVGMTADKIAVMRDAIENHPHFSLGGDALSVILDDLEAARVCIAQLEAQRGGNTVSGPHMAPDGTGGWILKDGAYQIPQFHAQRGEADPWTPSICEYDPMIHSSRDAAKWADLFVATFPGLADKRDTMLGWFANAMMAMHDSIKQERGGAVVVPEIPTWEECEEKVRRGEERTALEKFVLDHDWSKTDTQFRDGLEAVFEELRKSAIPADRVLADGMVGVDRDLLVLLDKALESCKYGPQHVLREAIQHALRAQQARGERCEDACFRS